MIFVLFNKNEWLSNPKGISIANLPTYYGKISYSIKRHAKKIIVTLKGSINSSCKRMILKSPVHQRINKILIDRKVSSDFDTDNHI